MDETNNNQTQNIQTVQTPNTVQSTQMPPGAQPPDTQTQQQSFDYDKLASIISGKQSVTEETVLKNYFRQQGLSKEQVESAIADYKAQQAAKQPDIGVLNGQLTAAQQAQAAAQAAAQEAQINAAAVMAAVSIGFEAKTIPYVLKMADLSQVIGQDGKISEEALKTAIGKVLEDIPALRSTPGNSGGFMQIGAPGANTSPQAELDNRLDRIFGVKKQ